MDKDKVLQALGQVEGGEADKVFREFLRGTARGILVGVMVQGV